LDSPLSHDRSPSRDSTSYISSKSHCRLVSGSHGQ
jgi:hypothetical protein